MQKGLHSTRGLCLALLTALVIIPVALLAGCGVSATTKAVSEANTSVALLATSTANDSVSSYNIVVTSLSLVSQSGESVPVIATPVQAEFTHLNGPVEPIAVAQVPQGVYSSAKIALKDYSIQCIGLGFQGGVQGQGASGGSVPANVRIAMPQPITVSGSNMTITLNLKLDQFVSSTDCSIGSIPLNQQFEIYSDSGVVEPVDLSPQKLTALQGVIDSISADGTSLTVHSIEGWSNTVAAVPEWTVKTNSATAFQGVSGPSSLDVGLPVELDAAIQTDGSLIASRVAVYDTSAANLSFWSGPLLSTNSSAQTLLTLGRETAGPIAGSQIAQVDWSQAKF